MKVETRRKGDKEMRRKGDKEMRRKGDKERGRKGDKSDWETRRKEVGKMNLSDFALHPLAGELRIRNEQKRGE